MHGVGSALFAKVRADVEAQHVEVPAEQDVGRHLRYLAGGEPDHQQPRAVGGAAHGRVPHVTSDRIVHHVYPRAACDLLHLHIAKPRAIELK